MSMKDDGMTRGNGQCVQRPWLSRRDASSADGGGDAAAHFAAQGVGSKNYRLDQFSVENLMEFLTVLDQDVEITIRPRQARSGVGHISVLAVQ